VVVLRDDRTGIETLMLRRNSKIAFGGMWVFPGGRVEDADRDGLVADDDALARRNALEIELAPPTWVTLEWLAGHASVAAALAAAGNQTPERFETRLAFPEIGPVAIWHGDAGYDASDADAPGPRHRLSMLPQGWHYERHD
jgi:8-oxo-dGTP pyrophosphatase MutT (NUDIX family)